MAKGKAKRRKHGPLPANQIKSGERLPKSMVIRIGASQVGPSVSQLAYDVRSIMEPNTASRLKERRNNKLRDYTTMAGPLGVTHMLLFSRSSSGYINLRIPVMPRGPTLHFRVENYSLSKDIHQSQKNPKTGGSDLISAPLLVMNNFTTPESSETNGEQQRRQRIPKHLESLCTTVFQSMFPPLNPVATPLQGVKRVLLLDRTTENASANDPSYTLNLRHYAIETRTAKSVPKPLRRLDAAEKLAHAGQKRKRDGLPNLGRLDDVADYLLDPHVADGFTSGSESEPETDAEVEVLAPRTQKVQRRGRKKNEGAADSQDPKANLQKKGIKLQELGPRMKLRLIKVEEGVCQGKVMWHEYIQKSEEEMKEMDKVHERRRVEKERRRAEQKANVERKRAEKKANGETTGDGESEEDEDIDEDILDDDDEWDGVDLDGGGQTQEQDKDRPEDENEDSEME